jgi:CNT family concentrative nucleoside transporter
MQAILGIGFLLILCFLLSEARRDVHWRAVAVGLVLQLFIATILLRVPVVSETLFLLNGIVEAVEQATRVGSEFVFGYVAGGAPPFAVTAEGALYIFAFRVLPQILVFSVLVALLWYWGILRWIVRGFGAVLQRALGLSGALGTAAASSVFLGMVETPLVVRAYLAGLSRSELFTLMTCGMSTVAGSIMVLYASVLSDALPGTLGHILAASVINVIGAVVYSRIMVPPNGTDEGPEHVTEGLEYSSNMDAITRGTADGLRLAVNVGAMVIVLVSLVALVNHMIGGIAVADAPLSLERIMGWVFSPIAWLIGVPWQEAQVAGGLLGSKLVLNELIAYLQLAALPDGSLTPATTLVMIYALCGFANFGSLGIMLGGLTTLIPERRDELLNVAPKTLISGTVVGLNTGALVALVSLI